jgi:RNA polymerase sigma factor (sigma-70 family)
MKKMTFRAGTEWDAEDVIQESYARALKYYKSFDGSNFDRWFNTILNNTLREHKNNEKGLVTTSFEEEEMGGTPCTYLPDRVVDEIYTLIDTKSNVQIEVLTMYFRHGYSAKDISCITEYSYAATHQIIQRFRNELKELYGS